MYSVSKIDPASFRDPSGFVFEYESGIYRCVDKKCQNDILEMEQIGFLKDLESSGMTVSTRVIDSSEALFSKLSNVHNPADGGFLVHGKIEFISYPSEWTVSMLIDAALLTLRIEDKLLERRYDLKDASAYNIQFSACRPIFIDIPSFEKLQHNVWMAYGQFCRMFLFPALLKLARGYDTKGYFLANMDGMDVVSAYKNLGRLRSLAPDAFIDVFLQRLVHKDGTATDRSKKLAEPNASVNPSVIRANIRRLISLFNRMYKRSINKSHWTTYEEIKSYKSDDERVKDEFILDFLKTRKPERVLDLGCNTGRYSIVAAESGADVVAVDSDHDCVDSIYRQIKGRKINLLPLWVDISNPSPGIGYMNVERRSFVDRANFNAVFALALIHHLLVSSRIPLESIRDMFGKLTSKWLVVEFVPVEDEMFQRLLSLRENIYSHVTRVYFEKVFKEKFIIRSSWEISLNGRVLYLMEKIVA